MIFENLTFLMAKVLGLAPYSYTIITCKKHAEPQKHIVFCYSFISEMYNLIILVLIVSVHCFYIFVNLHKKEELEETSRALNGIYILSEMIATISILFPFPARHRKLMAVFNDIQNVQCELQNLPDYFQTKFIFLSYLPLLHILFNLCILIIVCLTFNGAMFFIGFLTSLLIISGFILEYDLVVRDIHLKFQCINHFLKRTYISRSSKSIAIFNLETRGPQEMERLSALHKIRELYAELCKISSHMCEISSFPTLACLSALLSLLCHITYSMILLVIQKNFDDWCLVTLFIALLIYLTIPIFLLTQTVTNVTKEV